MDPPIDQVSDGRALPDITSGPEVQQNVKIRTDWKLDVFLPVSNNKKVSHFRIDVLVFQVSL